MVNLNLQEQPLVLPVHRGFLSTGALAMIIGYYSCWLPACCLCWPLSKAWR